MCFCHIFPLIKVGLYTKPCLVNNNMRMVQLNCKIYYGNNLRVFIYSFTYNRFGSNLALAWHEEPRFLVITLTLTNIAMERVLFAYM